MPRSPRVKLMVAAANRWGRGGREMEARLAAMRRRRLRGGRTGGGSARRKKHVNEVSGSARRKNHVNEVSGYIASN